MRALCKVLAFVDDEAEERGEPELAVLVVRQSDGLPGQGWWVGGAKKHGYTGLWEGPKATRLIRKLQSFGISDRFACRRAGNQDRTNLQRIGQQSRFVVH
jgi:hypothetical protein